MKEPQRVRLESIAEEVMRDGLAKCASHEEKLFYLNMLIAYCTEEQKFLFAVGSDR